MKNASDASRVARDQMERAGHELGELTGALERLAEVSISLRPIAEQLSDMTVETARRIWRSGSAGESFMPLITQLSQLGRDVTSAMGDLDAYVQRAATALRVAISETHSSSAELARVLPALEAENRNPPPVPEERVIAIELKLKPSEERDDADRKAPSVFDAWPDAPTRQNLKN